MHFLLLFSFSKNHVTGVVAYSYPGVDIDVEKNCNTQEWEPHFFLFFLNRLAFRIIVAISEFRTRMNG